MNEVDLVVGSTLEFDGNVAVSVLEAVVAPLNVGVPLAVAALGNVIGCVGAIDAVDDRGRDW